VTRRQYLGLFVRITLIVFFVLVVLVVLVARIAYLAHCALVAARLRRARLVVDAGSLVLAVAGCSAIAARAEPAHTQRVVMIVGGARDVNRAADLDSAMLARPFAEPARLSMVWQPGTGELAGPTLPSASVASRVLALAPLIDQAAQDYDVDRALLMAVIEIESGGDAQAVSPKGAVGLMQLMPGTGARHGATDLFDPRQNIGAGARYLRRLLTQFGDLQLALAAYNAGEGAVLRYRGNLPPYAETMRYVPRVVERYGYYRQQGVEMPYRGVLRVVSSRLEPTGQRGSARDR
jgi:soluble lytic murein transglycosylase-like protein